MKDQIMLAYHTGQKLNPFMVIYASQIWCQGNANGATVLSLEASSPCQKNVWVLAKRNVPKWHTETAFFSHFSPCRKLWPPFRSFLVLPQAQVENFSAFIFTGWMWKLQQTIKWFGGHQMKIDSVVKEYFAPLQKAVQ